MSKTKSILTIIFSALIILFHTSGAYASELETPRFVSLKHDQAFARKGPGKQYPIGWVYNRKSLPVEIILEYSDWRKVRDPLGEVSWMHKSQLSGNRTALVVPKGGNPYALLYKDKNIDSKILARLEESLIINILECESEWCNVRHGDFKGWIKRKSLWGIYPTERID